MFDSFLNTVPVVRVFTGGLRRQGATIVLSLVAIALLFGCGRRQVGPAMESNTNWLMSCEADADCGDALQCHCGVCSEDCSDDTCPAALECVTTGPAACDASPAASCQRVCDSDTDCSFLSRDASCVGAVCTVGDSGLSASALSSLGAGGGGSGGSAGDGSGGTGNGALPDSSVQLSAGDAHFCALSRGEVWCWGDNSVGQLGNLDIGPGPFEPVKVEGLSDIMQLESGSEHTCALRVGGEVWCWGGALSRYGSPISQSPAPELTCAYPGLLPGDEELNDHPCQPTPSRFGSGERRAVALSSHANYIGFEDGGAGFSPDIEFTSASGEGGRCGVERGNVYCEAFVTLPDYVSEWTQVQQVVSLGWEDYPVACALFPDGHVSCFGSNYDGLRGVGATEPVLPEDPEEVAIPSGVARLEGSSQRICARMLDGTVQCWGNNIFSEVGVPSATSFGCRGGACEPAPQLIEELDEIIDVALGYDQSCASDTKGQVWCWGLTSGAAPYSGVPVRFVGPWEDTSSECAAPNQAIHERVVDAFDASLTDCERDSDCVEAPLSAPCYEACSPGPITQAAADEIAAALDAASTELCDASIDVSTCGAAPECPASTDELRCVERICTRWHARPDCGHPCACRALDYIDFDLSLAQTCDGPDLTIVSTAPCPSCDESMVYVVVANTGGALFNGDVTITTAWQQEQLGELPPPFTQTLSLEPGEMSRPFPLAFNPMAPPQGIRLTLDAPGDCGATNDSFAAYAEVPWCYSE